jgi:hypothetical protein
MRIAVGPSPLERVTQSSAQSAAESQAYQNHLKRMSSTTTLSKTAKPAPSKSPAQQQPPFRYDSQGRKVWIVYLQNYRPGDPLD